MRAKNKLVCGVGINDADYEVVKLKCPLYIKWKSMLERVFSDKALLKRPKYKECSIAKEWLIFSNFRQWMEQQNWVGMHLDKDLLGDGKTYGPKHCVFVTNEVNSFMNEHSAANGEYPVGVSRRDRSKHKKFEAHCNVVIGGIRRKKFLGSYLTPEEAHHAWRVEKFEQAKRLASMQENREIADALIKRYTVQNITGE